MTYKANLHNAQQGHTATMAGWAWAKSMLMAGHELELTIKPAKRSLSQNARMWAMLTEISVQVDWHGRKLAPEDWKHVFSASLKKQDAVPGLEGGFVVLGLSTSKMTKAEMADLQTLMEAFGAQQGVHFAAQVDPDTGEIL